MEKRLGNSRPQRPRSFWSAPKIATSGQVQHRKSAIHGLLVLLRKLRVKSGKSDWFWPQSILFTKPFKTGTSLDFGQRSRFLLLTRRSAASEDENGVRLLLGWIIQNMVRHFVTHKQVQTDKRHPI